MRKPNLKGVEITCTVCSSPSNIPIQTEILYLNIRIRSEAHFCILNPKNKTE